jgi:ATP-binding cassette subfamily B protein
MKRYRIAYVVGTLSVFCTNGIWILFPLVIKNAIDYLRAHETNAHLSGVSVAKLLQYALLLVGIALAKGVFQFLTRWVMIGISRDIELDLRNDLFRHLERLSWSWYQRTRTGDVMARATNDLNAVRMLLGPAIMYSANTVVYTAGALSFMLGLSPKLTLYAFLPLPIVSVVIHYFGRQIHERFERIQAQFSDISAKAQENFSGARVIRAYVQEEAEIRSFERANLEYIGRSMKLVWLMGMLFPTLLMLLGLAGVLVLWLGGREVIHGHLTVGGFVAFNTYMVQLTFPIIAIGWVVSLFQRGTASMGRIAEILREQPEIADEQTTALGIRGDGLPPQHAQERRVPGAPVGDTLQGEIEFRDLEFSYAGRASNPAADSPNAAPANVLHQINLHIPAGTSLAIVGPTGSGKSTLVSLIPRIYDASRGSVLIDGRPVREYPLALLRRNIGFVPQETFLFGDTIRGNIALGAEHATLEEVRRGAQAAGIAADIEAFPGGYDTVVGERGITLSGGQKQRTAIARALVREPRILILDDALSSVDTQTEDHILNHLREIMRGRTTIFISHRVSTVRNADRIAVLHGGRIVEYGTHDELIAREGYYTDLYNKQLLEEELASETA